MKNIAVILAAGKGTRVGGTVPKQFLPLKDGLSVLEYCVRTFERCQAIDEILIVTHSDFVSRVQQSMLSQGWQKVSDIVIGGKERWESSWNAIQSISNSPQGEQSAIARRASNQQSINLLLHDCARPFVSERILQNVCAALEEHEAVTVAVPATDTMYICDTHYPLPTTHYTIHSIPDRATMFRAQTPQAFRLDVIKRAFDRALNPSPYEGESERIPFTDDCGILYRYMPEVPIFIVQGEEANKKLTFQEDFCCQ